MNAADLLAAPPSTTRGAALPTVVTAMPEPRSMSELPSTSTRTPPPARRRTPAASPRRRPRPRRLAGLELLRPRAWDGRRQDASLLDPRDRPHMPALGGGTGQRGLQGVGHCGSQGSEGRRRPDSLHGRPQARSGILQARTSCLPGSRPRWPGGTRKEGHTCPTKRSTQGWRTGS